MKSLFKTRKIKTYLMVSLLITGAFALSGCTLFGGSSDSGIDSSVFLSTDGGNNWREAVAMATPGEDPKNIRSVNVNNMSFDPQDNMAVYLASSENGLFYTYNIVADGWHKVEGLPSAGVSDVQVDPLDKCTIYAAIANRLYRSNDCSRTFEQVYYDNNEEVTVNTIAIDHYNSRNVYIGTSRGEIIKSIDWGSSWRTIHRLEGDGVTHLILSPQDSRLGFVASKRNKIYSFTTNPVVDSRDSISVERSFAVQNWTDLTDVLSDFELGSKFRDFVVGKSDGKMFIATNQTILRSPDNGITWEKLKLIPTEEDAVINSLDVDAQNSDNIFYVTNTTFYRSTDGGVTWATKKLPTSRAGSEILVDPQNPNNLYLGTKNIKR